MDELSSETKSEAHLFLLPPDNSTVTELNEPSAASEEEIEGTSRDVIV